MESSRKEYKRIYTEDIRKELIAFANSQGGSIYIGVEDDGTICGVKDPDDVILRVSASCRDSILPDLTMFVDYEIREVQGKQIVVVHVDRGTGRPYYISAKGLRPAGVYVRQGTSSAPASEAMIREMIKESDGDSYETMRSLNQDLSFDEAKKVFAAQKVEFGELQMQTLGLKNAAGIYTNLALLLSDQCPHIIKAARFGTDTQDDFQDRKEFSGSLFRQLSDAYAYLDMLNQTRASFQGLYRTDQRDYPETAIREALLNAVIHRDYGRSAPTLIGVYADRMELLSVGGLPQDVVVDDIRMGLSVCRNPQLANIFYRLKMIEAYGTGIRKIYGAYRGMESQVEIETSSHAFKIILPNRYKASAAKTDILREKITYGDRKNNQIRENPPVGSDYEAIALAWIKGRQSVTRQEVEEYLGVSLSTANRVLKSLLAEGKIRQSGRGRTTRYLKNDQE